MDPFAIWIIAACVLAVGEMLTTSFFLAPFAAGALVAGVGSLAGLGTVPAVAVFLLVSVALFVFVRPIAQNHLRTPARIRTGTAALIGRPAIVLERVSNLEAVGCVKVEGEVWTARSYDEDEIIEVGAPVRVVEIRGATALVAKEESA